MFESLTNFLTKKKSNVEKPKNREGFSSNYKHLKQNSVYIVSKEFSDFDSTRHKEGTVLRFVGYSFFPYDAGLTLLFEHERSDYTVRLRLDQNDSQSRIDENLDKYIEPFKQ